MKHVLTRVFAALSLTLAVVWSSPSLALSLDEAKAQGLVGERLNGYLGAVAQPPSPTVVELMRDINQRRRAQYQKIARDNGTTLQTVEQLAGRKAIERSAPYHYVQTPSGEWVRRSALSP